MSSRLCPGCGCVISQYNPGDLCAACSDKAEAEAVEEAVASCYLEGEPLRCLVAGILLVHYATHPDEPVYLQAELRKLGVEATTDKIHDAKRQLDRRGFEIDSQPPYPGYVLRAWLTPTLTWASRERQRREERSLLAKDSEQEEET